MMVAIVLLMLRVGFTMKVLASAFVAICMVTAGAARVAAQVSSQQAASQAGSQAGTPATTQTTSQATTQSTPHATVPVAAQVPEQSAETTATDKSKIVYVSDFELDALDVNGGVEQSGSASAPPLAATADPRRLEVPTEQARRLVDYMSATLVKELESAGYTARRLRPTDDRPTDGIRIAGIFTEPDEQNRLRRAVLGTVTLAGKMALFVGIGNLARPDQAFYAVASPNSAENKTETVITVSSYAPVAKFEIEKSVTEKAVKDTAAGIVADLNALLSANVVALTR
jgi:hypothetical protein